MSFRQAGTSLLSYATSRLNFKSSLELLPTIGTVEVSFDQYDHTDENADASTDVACTEDGSNLITVTFTTELGDVPALKFVEDGVDSIEIFADGVTTTNSEGTLIRSQRGTFENEVSKGYTRANCTMTEGQRAL